MEKERLEKILLALVTMATLLGALLYALSPRIIDNRNVDMSTTNNNETTINPVFYAESTSTGEQMTGEEYDMDPCDFAENQNTGCFYYEGEPCGHC